MQARQQHWVTANRSTLDRMTLLFRPSSPPQIITSLLNECVHAVVRMRTHFLKDERQTGAIYFPRLDIDHK